MFERLKQKSPAVEVIKSAVAEAARRGDRRVGTEHLFLGLFYDQAADPATVMGQDVEAARAALVDLDKEALGAIGIDVEGLSQPTPPRSSRRPSIGSFTSAARSAVDSLISAKNSRVAPNRLLVTLLELRPPDPAAQLITRLGLDREDVRRRLPLE